MALEFDADRIVERTQGRQGVGARGPPPTRAAPLAPPGPVPRARHERLLLAAQRLESDLDVQRRANEAYEHYRATARDRLGRRPGGRSQAYRPPELPAGTVK